MPVKGKSEYRSESGYAHLRRVDAQIQREGIALDNTVVLAISADLPFAQCRFCEVEGLKHVIPLSTFRSGFADNYGVKLVDSFLPD